MVLKRAACLLVGLLLCLSQILVVSPGICAAAPASGLSSTRPAAAAGNGLTFVLASADSISQLDALILVSQRDGDFVSLSGFLRERMRVASVLRIELLSLMDKFEPGVARYANELAPCLLGPFMKSAQDRERTLKSLLPYVESLKGKGAGSSAGSMSGAGVASGSGLASGSGTGFETWAFAAGIILSEHGKHALASRYFERAASGRAAGEGSSLGPHALYLALESCGASREFERMLALEKRLESGQAGGADAVGGFADVPAHILKRARVATGVALMQSRLSEDGRALLEELLRGDLSGSESAKVGLALGRYYAAKGDYGRAAQSFVDAFENGMSTAEAVAACDEYMVLARRGAVRGGLDESMSLARCLARGNREKDAARILETMLEPNPRSTTVTWELARLRYRMKEYEKAAQLFRKLQSLERSAEESQRSRLWFARCERQAGRIDNSVKIMREIAKRSSGVAGMEAAWEVGFDLESLGRLEEAGREYASLHQRFAASRLGQESLWRKGFCDFRRGRYAEARATFSLVRKNARPANLRDMAAFWVLKCDLASGKALTREMVRTELAGLKPDGTSLYGAVLLALWQAERPGRELFLRPWADVSASAERRGSTSVTGALAGTNETASSTRSSAAGAAQSVLGAQPAVFATQPAGSRQDSTALMEELPQQFRNGAALLRFGLTDLAKAELSVCERKLSRSRDALMLLAQLYWRNGLYRRGVLIAERLLAGSDGGSDGSAGGNRAAGGGESAVGGAGAGEGARQTEAGSASEGAGQGIAGAAGSPVAVAISAGGSAERTERFLKKITYPICFAGAVYEESRSQGVDPFLVLSVMKRESTFEPTAVSRAGATGLMQLMPGTVRAVAAYLGQDTAKIDLTDPDVNLRYGIWHLGRLIGRYSDSVVAALAAYNAGENNAERWLRGAKSGTSDQPDGFVYMESISYRETRDYVHHVLADLHTYRALY